MRAIQHCFQILRIGLFIKRFFTRQNIYNHGFIDAYLARFFEPNSPGLRADTLKKIKKYYCLGIPITCEVYARVYGNSLTPNELERSVLTGIVTPVMDDFTDEGLLNDDDLNSLTRDPDTFKPSTPVENLACKITSKLLHEVPDRQGFAHALQQTMQAQHWSAKQMNKETSLAELAEISLEKGAWSHILFHYLINQQPSREMIAVLHQMGGMLQWSNDIFDVYKDYETGIRTVANTCENFVGLEETYLHGCRKFCAMARRLPYDKKNLEFFIRFFVLVMARGMVALKQFQKLQKSLGGGALPISQLQRKQLICDMEKTINQLRTIKYALRILK